MVIHFSIYLGMKWIRIPSAPNSPKNNLEILFQKVFGAVGNGFSLEI